MAQTPMLVDEMNYLANIHSTFDTPETYHSAGEINSFVKSLHTDFKTPLKMHMEGFKYKEIAEKLEMPIGTVKSRIFFGRKKLQKMIGN